MGLLHQQLKGAKEELNIASSQIQEQNETVVIMKQKYAAAIEKVHRVQGQVELLEEELQYSQQQVDTGSFLCLCTVVYSSILKVCPCHYLQAYSPHFPYLKFCLSLLHHA